MDPLPERQATYYFASPRTRNTPAGGGGRSGRRAAVQRIVADLEEAGLSLRREGRRRPIEVHGDGRIRRPVVAHHEVSGLLELFSVGVSRAGRSRFVEQPFPPRAGRLAGAGRRCGQVGTIPPDTKASGRWVPPTLLPEFAPDMRRVILEGLVKRYGGIAAVDGASFELRPGGMTYVLGPSGAGKTTLARLVAGLERPDDGEIYLRRPDGPGGARRTSGASAWSSRTSGSGRV